MNCVWQTPTKNLLLNSEETHLWKAKLDEFPIPTPEKIALLSTKEQQQAQQLINEEHRHNFIWSHVLLRTILSLYSSLLPSEFSFYFNKYGKPYLKNELPFKIFFNLSHTKNQVLLGFSRSEEIGVDIEWMNTQLPYLELSARFFCKEEHEQLLKTPYTEQIKMFYRIWVRKEAYIKALGKGLSHPLSDFNVNPLQANPVTVGEWVLSDIFVSSEYAAALALPKPKKLTLLVSTPSLFSGAPLVEFPFRGSALGQVHDLQ